jgi:hypothetical protein
MEKAKEATSETEAKGGRALRFVDKGSIIEL